MQEVLAGDGIVLEVTKGQARVSLEGIEKILDAPASQEIAAPATITTLAESQASIIFSSGTTARLDSASSVELSAYQNANNKITIKFSLKQGDFWSRVQRLLDVESDYEVTAANTVAVVRGTSLNHSLKNNQVSLQVLDNEVQFSVFDQTSHATLPGGQAIVSAGNFTQVDLSQLPSAENPLKAEAIPPTILQSSWFQDNLNKDKKIDEAIKNSTGDGGVNKDQAVRVILPSVISLSVTPSLKGDFKKLPSNVPLATGQPSAEASASATPQSTASATPNPSQSIKPSSNTPSPTPVKLSVVSISPNSAPGNDYQYTKVTIKGTGFGAGATASLGPYSLANLKIINSATLEGTLSAGIKPGQYDLTVSLGGKQAVLPKAFNIYEPIER